MGGACSTRRGGHAEPAVTPRVRAVATGALMREGDRSRLEGVVAERAHADARDGYRIGPDDLLDIRIPDLIVVDAATRGQDATHNGTGVPSIADAPVFQQGMRVSSHGEVSVPYLGLVRAEGLTATELEENLAQRLRTAGILKAPQVSVQIAEYRSQVVAVIGSVERPGLYPLTRPRATLADMIWAAGGPAKEAGRVVEFAPVADSAPVSPEEAAHTSAPVRLDLEALLHAPVDHGRGLNPRVRPGDVITVSPAGSVLVDGWVQKPGSYPVTRGLTLSGALAAAGGGLFPADRRHATVKRVLGPGEERSFTVDLVAVADGRAADVPITDGDVVRVPASTIRLVPWGFYSLAKGLVYVGGSVPLF